MVALMKLRIKFGSQGAERVFPKTEIINGCSYKEKKTEQPTGEVIFSDNGSRKHGHEEPDEFQTNKKQKLDGNVFRQCSVLLKSMKAHQFGWVFDEPVDPVKLNIPDYFSVVSKPMDFSTIGCKLVKNGYNSKEEFAADVRLTFSNAMLYNPRENMVHKMAKELNEFFEFRWKSLVRKCNSKETEVESDCSGQSRSETPAFSESSPISSTESMEEKARKVSHSSKPVEEKDQKVSHSVRPTAIATKPGLKKLDQGHFGTGSIVKCSSKVANGCGQHDPANGAPNFAAAQYGSSGNTGYNCLKFSAPSENCPSLDTTLESPCGDIGSEMSSITDCRAKSTSESQYSKSDPQSGVSSMNEENGCQNSQPQKSPNDVSWDQDTILDVPLSPKKALRAAILKSRFADTILKAKQRKVLDNVRRRRISEDLVESCLQGKNADPSKLEKEKERLKRMQLEEKARMEAEIRAAEAAMQTRKETQLKMERERQRLLLQKMEEAAKVEEENNLRVEREMKNLFGSGASISHHQLLENFGLVMKEDDCLEDFESETSVLGVDFEEGEIF
ncbi:PREDICTED: transcription factor GTE12-like isoform X2 [Tarenaya hassleriana]|uniref:transcription factor GTE12-like isoform X2 n=1 Tax=Tarenaya hassleriana TaxID=28532 RepID=UPI00053C8CEA|nr:PREDICTED: transcription factor GTE12-like isoform X2 [Tarenaya hassleriana]